VFSAVVVSQTGKAMEGQQVRWSSSAPLIATVGEHGLVHGEPVDGWQVDVTGPIAVQIDLQFGDYFAHLTGWHVHHLGGSRLRRRPLPAFYQAGLKQPRE
jgi:hypothetical protein